MSASDDYQKLISSTTSIKDKLDIIEKLTVSRLCIKMGVDTVPDKYSYLVTNIVAARYARVGNEGMSSYTQDGMTQVFNEDDFTPYQDEIDRFRNGDDFYKPRHGSVFIL